MTANYNILGGVDRPVVTVPTADAFQGMSTAIKSASDLTTRLINKDEDNRLQTFNRALKDAEYRGDEETIAKLLPYTNSFINPENRTKTYELGRTSLENTAVGRIENTLGEALRTSNPDLLAQATSEIQGSIGNISPANRTRLTNLLNTNAPQIRNVNLSKDFFKQLSSASDQEIAANTGAVASAVSQIPEFTKYFDVEGTNVVPKDTTNPEDVLKQQELLSKFQSATAGKLNTANTAKAEMEFRRKLLQEGNLSPTQVEEVIASANQRYKGIYQLPEEATQALTQANASADQTTLLREKELGAKYAFSNKFTEQEIKSLVEKPGDYSFNDLVKDLETREIPALVDSKGMNTIRNLMNEGFTASEIRDATALAVEDPTFSSKGLDVKALRVNAEIIKARKNDLNKRAAIEAGGLQNITNYYRDLQAIRTSANIKKLRNSASISANLGIPNSGNLAIFQSAMDRAATSAAPAGQGVQADAASPTNSAQLDPKGFAIHQGKTQKDLIKTINYDSTIEKASKKYGVNPVLLKTLIGSESSFDPNAKNPDSGALGLAQIVERYHPEAYKKATDPEFAIDYAAKLLNDYTKEAKGDVKQAIYRYKGIKTVDWDKMTQTQKNHMLSADAVYDAHTKSTELPKVDNTLAEPTTPPPQTTAELAASRFKSQQKRNEEEFRKKALGASSPKLQKETETAYNLRQRTGTPVPKGVIPFKQEVPLEGATKRLKAIDARLKELPQGNVLSPSQRKERTTLTAEKESLMAFIKDGGSNNTGNIKPITKTPASR